MRRLLLLTLLSAISAGMPVSAMAGNPLSGSGGGSLYDYPSDAVIGRISASVHGIHDEATGFVDFRFSDSSESWQGTIHYADYWYDAGGAWYVAFVEGCREGPVCEPFVLQLVDGRARADGIDEVSLSWTTREDFDFQTDWETWSRIDSGNLVVPAVL